MNTAHEARVGLRGLVVVSVGSMGYMMLACLLWEEQTSSFQLRSGVGTGDNTRLVIFIVLVVGTAELVYTS